MSETDGCQRVNFARKFNDKGELDKIKQALNQRMEEVNRKLPVMFHKARRDAEKVVINC